jgi:small GTP-binding protein
MKNDPGHEGSRVEDVEYNNIFKVILIGDPKVGKSCLRKRLTSPEESMCEYQPTEGIDFDIIKIPQDKEINKLQIWDVAGAGDKNHPKLIDISLRKSAAVLILFDLTNRATFESLEKYMKLVKDKATLPNPIIVLVGTKSDLIDDRQVLMEEASAFAQANDMEYVETSSVDGYTHYYGADHKNERTVAELFEWLTKKMLEEIRLTRATQGIDSSIQDFRDALRLATETAPIQLVINGLDTYIKRIESYKKPGHGSEINFSHGFWFMPQPRAENRELNYELAKTLRLQLERPLACNLSELFRPGSIETKRIEHLAKIAPDSETRPLIENEPSGSRIRSSELNKVISYAQRSFR